MPIKLITPPAEEPVTLTEMKSHLRVDGNDLDSVITSLIKSAREYCEKFQNRVFITQTWELVLDYLPDMPLRLPKTPLLSVSSIKLVDSNSVETVFDPTNYIIDTYSEPGRIAFANGKSWPVINLSPVNGVKIQFVTGYGPASSVPESVKEAMVIYVTQRFENPDSDEIPKAVEYLLWPDRMVPI